jgi:hypothetical protein
MDSRKDRCVVLPANDCTHRFSFTTQLNTKNRKSANQLLVRCNEAYPATRNQKYEMSNFNSNIPT